MLKLYKFTTVAAIFIGLICLSIQAPATVGHCQQKHKGEWIQPEGYPLGGFDGWGRIDRISGDTLVMDDTVYTLSPSVKYHTENAGNVSSSWLKKGNLAGFIKNNAGEVISLWRIGD